MKLVNGTIGRLGIISGRSDNDILTNLVHLFISYYRRNLKEELA